MSYSAKRELLVQIGPHYCEAEGREKRVILDAFVAATGYARKYAIRLLHRPAPLVAKRITRPRERRYGKEVQEALVVAWTAANCICAKRLIPFLPVLVESLEQHGHLSLTDEARAHLLALSPATADRILSGVRRGGKPRGVTATKAGTLLKHQVPVRTFADWNEAQPGFFEVDLVAHGGTSVEGMFLWSLVLTDVATGWTECLALRHRSQEAVVDGLERVRQVLPFALLGLDTDNGSEFLNQEVLAYCTQKQITFTRGRAYKKNDQCFVEQKNGSIVRQLVGYDRYDGEVAYRQLAELYRAARLYVNFFQPSVKLLAKHREGSKVQRTYDAAQTPFQRLVASGLLHTEKAQHLTQVFRALDPVRLRRQLQALQDALWWHAVQDTVTPVVASNQQPVCFSLSACLSAGETLGSGRDSHAAEITGDVQQRKYHRTRKPLGARTWRTRQDPFDGVSAELHHWLLSAPERTAHSLLQELQETYPGQYPASLLRTLQRRVRVWRRQMLLEFDDHRVDEDTLLNDSHPTMLRALPTITSGATVTVAAPT